MMDIYAFLPSDTSFASNGERPVQPSKCIERKDKDIWEVETVVELGYQDVFRHDYILFLESQYGYQPFRINNPETGKNTIQSILKHVGFDTRNHFVSLATPLELNCQDAMQYVVDHAVPSCPFTVYSDITSINTITIENSNLYDAFVTLAEAYGGYMDFDGFQVRIMENEGADRGETIEYGKNLIGATVTENWDNVVTDLMPVTTSGLYLPEVWLYSDIVYDRAYARRVEFDTDTVENLAFLATLYLARYKVPKINYVIKSEALQNVFRGDTIKSIARQFTIQLDVISYERDVLRRKIIATEFGNYRNTLKNFFGNLRGEIETSTLQKAQFRIDELKGIMSLLAFDVNGIDGVVNGTDGLSARMNAAELKITPLSITQTVEDTTTTLAKKAYVDLTAGAAAISAAETIRNEYGETISDIQSFFDFIPTGMLVRMLGSKFATLYAADKIEFMQDGNVIQWMSAFKNYMTDLVLTGTFSMPTHKFETLANGHTVVRYIGG